MFKYRYFILFAILTFIEQSLKFWIYNNHYNSSYDIINKFLTFNPKFNFDLSWINNLLKLNINKTFHVVFVIIMIFSFYFLYRYLKDNQVTGVLIDTIFTILYSGAFCSLIDKLYWNGSLDYIQFKDFIIFDLKDIYLLSFLIILFYLFIIDYKGIRKLFI